MRCAISSAREIDYRYHRLGSDIERLDHLFRIIKLTAREVNNQSVHKLSDNNSEYKLVGFVLISSVNKISVSTDLYLKYHIPLYTYFTVYFAIPRLSRSFKMPPNVKDGPDVNGVLFEDDAATPDMALNRTPVQQADNYPKKLVWRNIILFGYLHLAAIYGAYLFLFSAKWQTDVLAYFLYVASGLGITAGAHRLWAHKSYKAKWPLRVILIIFNTIAFQDSALDWSRDHRMHHKYSETDADPHNATRGFFFSHIGWLLVRKHPEIKNKGKGLDLSDLYADPILRFQKKYYLILMPLACFILPTVIPVYYWGETWTNAFFVATLFRYTFILNVTWLVNSAAHKWGGKPYDKNIKPSENLSVALFAFGEGFHNYHHTFPWDYKTAELGNNRLNFTTNFINFFAKLGWAYDMKTVSDEIVQSRVKRTGDGSHHLWGWGDKDQPKEEAAAAIRINPKDD